MAGIYKLTAPNGKCYIGQSFDLDRRLRDYATRVHAGQRHLHRAVKKYGWDNFKVEILWRTKHPERYRNLNVLLDTLEIAWIKKFDSVTNGYNLQYGGSNGLHSEETKQKMAAAQRGKTHSEETKRKISAARRGKALSEETKQKMSATRAGKALSEEHRLSLSRGVVQYNLEGKKIKTWDAITLAAGGDESVRRGIIRVCKGERRTAGGFRWRYLSDGIEELKSKEWYLAVEQYTQEGKLVKTWESAREAHREIGVHSGSIHRVCRGKGLSAGGFKWKYA